MFWLIALGLAALAAAPLVRAIARTRGAGDASPFDVRVYRDQLREVERDLARGTVTEGEAEAIRTEVSRRLLEADRKANEAPSADDGAPRAVTGIAAFAVAVAVVGGAGLIYETLGAPGYPDLPLEKRKEMAEEQRLSRPGQSEAEARMPPQPPAEAPSPEYLDLVAKLRTAVAERPDDLQGHRLLARQEASLGNFAAAHAAQAQVIAILGGDATAGDYADLAELLVLAAGGYVSPEAEAALRETLARDPQNGVARYYSGLLAVQTGRPDIAFRLWRALLEQGPAGAPWMPPIRDQIGDLARIAGVNNYDPPASPRGPSGADVEAAGEMSPEERQDMIRGMVAGLAERLATEGGPPGDWARLIRAYGVLGETERAAAIWSEAQEVFPEEARGDILEAARSAGVADR